VLNSAHHILQQLTPNFKTHFTLLYWKKELRSQLQIINILRSVLQTATLFQISSFAQKVYKKMLIFYIL